MVTCWYVSGYLEQHVQRVAQQRITALHQLGDLSLKLLFPCWLRDCWSWLDTLLSTAFTTTPPCQSIIRYYQLGEVALCLEPFQRTNRHQMQTMVPTDPLYDDFCLLPKRWHCPVNVLHYRQQLFLMRDFSLYTCISHMDRKACVEKALLLICNNFLGGVAEKAYSPFFQLCLGLLQLLR